MEVKDYLVLLRRWWWALLIGVVVGGGGGYIYATMQVSEPIYRARATVMIGTMYNSANSLPNIYLITALEEMAQSYSEMIRRKPILDAAIKELKLDMDWTTLQGRVSGRLIPETQLFEIYVTDPQDPERAKVIGDELARQLVIQTRFPGSEDQQKYHEFTQAQIEDLKTKIDESQERLKNLRASLELETTPDGIARRRDEIDALQTRVTEWQSAYAGLLLSAQRYTSPDDHMRIIEPAVVSTVINRPDMNQYMLMGAGVGLAVVSGLIYLREHLDDSLKTKEDIERTLGVPILGAIPQTEVTGLKETILQKVKRDEQGGSFSPFAEAYRVLRVNIQVSSLLASAPSAAMLITSPGAGEGKSTTAFNLAKVMAHAGKQIILVDADLRRPTIHKQANVSNEVGLVDLLVDDISLESALAQSGVENLRILPSGPIPANPADIMATPQMERLIARLTEQADLVIFDTPPLLVVADASVLTTHIKNVILIVDANNTRLHACQRSKEILERVGSNLLGVVLNKFHPQRDAGYGYGYYNYQYQYYYSSDQSQKRRKPSRRKELPTAISEESESDSIKR